MDPMVETVMRMGDNALVLGHRVSEWCGHGPALEEDIALANTALDLIGQAQMWLALAGEMEGAGRSADDLAYMREAGEFRNFLLLEQPNGDFGQTIMRQFLFDAWHLPMLEGLAGSSETRVAAIAAKTAKEVHYHLDRSRGLVIALGDGTKESNDRMQSALDLLWPFAGEMLVADAVDAQAVAEGVAPDPATLAPQWRETVGEALAAGNLTIPESDFAHRGGKDGSRHTEHLGHMLAVMQVLPRSHPDAVW